MGLNQIKNGIAARAYLGGIWSMAGVAAAASRLLDYLNPSPSLTPRSSWSSRPGWALPLSHGGI